MCINDVAVNIFEQLLIILSSLYAHLVATKDKSMFYILVNFEA